MEILGDYITLTKDTEIHAHDDDDITLTYKGDIIYIWNRNEQSDLIDALMAFYDHGDFTKVD